MKKSLMIAAAAGLVLGGMTAAPDAYAGPEGKCKACHSFDKGGRDKMGPNLYGIIGKKAGSKEGFRYSDDLANADFVWDEEKLKKWMENSKNAIKEFTGNDGASTKMPVQRVKGKRADRIIEYIKEQSAM